jgi:hypothetical protein
LQLKEPVLYEQLQQQSKIWCGYWWLLACTFTCRHLKNKEFLFSIVFLLLLHNDIPMRSSSIVLAICSLIASSRNKKKRYTYHDSGMNWPSSFTFVPWVIALGRKLFSVPMYKGIPFHIEVGFDIYG